MKEGTVKQSERKESKGGELSKIQPSRRGGSGDMESNTSNDTTSYIIKMHDG